MYDYYENVKDDVENYINENKEYFKATDLEELEEELNDECWISDSVTGNGSGSYTFNTIQAEENLVGNWDLLLEALENFGQADINPIEKGAEWCDVTMRCYLRNIPKLPRAVIEKTHASVAGDDLLYMFPIYETVIFDHTHRDAQGRTWRETIRGDYRKYQQEKEAAAK